MQLDMEMSDQTSSPGSATLSQRAANLLAYGRSHGLRSTLRFSWWKLRSALARNELTWNLLFKSNLFVSTGEISDYSVFAESIWSELVKLPGLETREWTVSRDAYQRYVESAAYTTFDPYYRGGESGDVNHRAEKLLQHYISMELLKVAPDELFIDVASNTSPMRHIVKRLYGASTYSLDLSYPPGINGELVGADAGDMPFETGSVSKMTLHCSFEHFAFGADSRFVRECSRVLRPGGRVCIVPLYILPEYCIRVDPTLEIDLTIRDREGAKIVYVRDYQVDYGRFYSPAALKQRIVDCATGLKVIVYRIRGLETLQESNVYSQFALVLEKE